MFCVVVRGCVRGPERRCESLMMTFFSFFDVTASLRCSTYEWGRLRLKEKSDFCCQLHVLDCAEKIVNIIRVKLVEVSLPQF